MYYLHLPVPRPVKNEVDTWRQRYQTQPKSSDPHITLVPPHELVGNKTEPQLIATCEDAINGRGSFTAEFLEPADFNNCTIIILRIKPSVGLLQLHTNLTRALEASFVPLPPEQNLAFVPHITLVDGVTGERGRQILHLLQKDPPTVFAQSFLIDHIELLRRLPHDDSWRVIKRWRLPMRNNG